MIKYLWSAAGYALIAVPILFTRTKRSLGIQTGRGKREDRVNDAVAGRTESVFCFCFVFLEEYAAELGGWLGPGGVCWLRLGGSLLGFCHVYLRVSVLPSLLSVIYRVLTGAFNQQHTYPTDVCSSH